MTRCDLVEAGILPIRRGLPMMRAETSRHVIERLEGRSLNEGIKDPQMSERGELATL